jgi:hypothetical protein
MKKARYIGVICFLMIAGASLGAQEEPSAVEPGDPWRMPDRIVEFGLDLDLGFGNSMIKLGDVFNFRKTLLIDLSAMSKGKFSAREDLAVSAFLDLRFGKNLSVGLFSGVQIEAFQSAPEEFTELLRRGNVQTKSMKLGMSAGAAAFVDAGFRVEAAFDKLRFTVKPAAYIPLLYLPPLDMAVDLTVTGQGMVLSGSAQMNLYSAVSLEQALGGNGFTDLASLIPSPIPLGFDLALEGRYSLLPILDLGLDIARLPLFPAQLRHRMRQELKMEGDWSDMYDKLTGGDFEMPVIETPQSFAGNASFMAFRPLRFDLFAEYRPIVIDLFVFRAHIGFSVLTIFGYDTACFNAGLGGEIRIANILGLSLETDYTERLWTHAFGLRLNLRALELKGEIALKGPDILSSLKGRGLGAFVGIRLGF